MMKHTTPQNLVLVSGASGYLGCHCVYQLLQHGYRVRGTVRSLQNDHKVNPIKQLCSPDHVGQLELIEADLLQHETWTAAVKGCRYVLHTASPFPSYNPQNEQELIKPAVDGTLNVLKACAKEPSIQRVVLTSSVAAIASGYSAAEQEGKVFSEEDWTRLEGSNVSPYEKSKTLAEKTAWDFVENIKGDENKFELCTICPSFIVGPMLHKTECTSAEVRQMLGMDPLRETEKAVVGMGHSLIEIGIVPKSETYIPPHTKVPEEEEEDKENTAKL